ncbi:MAG: helix-turn-helix domain-containing protein [Bacteroidetes bacterium]|nr:helix-turn-helix domain-containing protein [Bacteroidota bacterium]
MKPTLKPIISNESSIFKVLIQGNDKEFDYPWHYHPELELTYILSNRGTRYVGNSIETFEEDDFVLLGSNLPHCWIKSTDHQETSSAIVIYMFKSFVENELFSTQEFNAIQKLSALASKGVRYDKKVATKFKDRLIALLSLPPFEKMIHFLELLNDLASINDYSLLCEQNFNFEFDDISNERMNIIYDYIQKNHLKKITLADIGAAVHMSESYFSRYFSKIMKKTFFEYLNEYKINKACRLLIETDKQISEICYASGYDSLPFFYRQFKKIKKCQPKMFKKIYNKATF